MKLARFIVIVCLSMGKFCNAYSDGDTKKYDACFDTAEQYYQVPKEILKAIAFVESHYNPNAYNENSNGTYDIGLMQINSTWLPKLATLGITEQMLYEPCQSIYMGAWVLANNIKTYGLNWTAVQRYNGNDVDLKYATKVYNRIQETYPSLLSPSQAKLIPMNIKATSNLPKKSNESITNKEADISINSTKNIDKNLIVNYSESKIHKVETAQEYSNEVDSILRKSGVKSIPIPSQNNVVTSSEIDKKITQRLSSNFVKIEAESKINLAKTELKKNIVVESSHTKNVKSFVVETGKPVAKLENNPIISKDKFNQFYLSNQPKNLDMLINKYRHNIPQICDKNEVINTNQNINNSYKFVISQNDICNINGYRFCNLNTVDFIKIVPDFISPNINSNAISQTPLSKKSSKINHRKSKNKTSTMLVI